MILKPDKGQGIVLINKDEYNRSLEKVFNNKKKFKVLQEDPTLRNLSTVQSYLNTLLNRNEISEDIKKKMRPVSAQISRAHRLLKIHKEFTNIPRFRPIIDTTIPLIMA